MENLTSSVLRPVVYDEDLGMSFLNENVHRCLFPGQRNVVPWLQVFQESAETGPVDVRGIVQAAIRPENRNSKIINQPLSILSPRLCSMKVAPTQKCWKLSPDNCNISISIKNVNALCLSREKNTFPNEDAIPTEFSVPYNTRGSCELRTVMSEAGVLPNTPDYYELVEKVLNREMSVVYVRRLNSPHRINHWQSIECTIKTNVNAKYVDDECHIIACETGFFFVDGKCRLPQMLTFEIEAEFTIALQSMKTVMNLIRTSIGRQRHMSVQNLGDRVVRLENSLKYIDHYSIISISAKDQKKVLPVTMAIWRNLQLLEQKVASEIRKAQVCFLFREGIREIFSRCDDIVIGNGVYPKIENYTLNNFHDSNEWVQQMSEIVRVDCNDLECADDSASQRDINNKISLRFEGGNSANKLCFLLNPLHILSVMAFRLTLTSSEV